mgnify:CR=1 FL=1
MNQRILVCLLALWMTLPAAFAQVDTGTIAGSVRDITNSTTAPILFGAATLVVSALALLAFRLVQR